MWTSRVIDNKQVLNNPVRVRAQWAKTDRLMYMQHDIIVLYVLSYADAAAAAVADLLC